MFSDSGNIISDETFCTQSQIMVEKVPEFLAESLIPVGVTLVSHDPEGSCDTNGH